MSRDYVVRDPVPISGAITCRRGLGDWIGSQEGPPPPCHGTLPPLPWKDGLARCPECGLTHGVLPGDNGLYGAAV